MKCLCTSPVYLSLLNMCLFSGPFFFEMAIWIWANHLTNTKTALCFANIETGLIVYNIYGLEEINVILCTVYVKSS